MLKKILSIVLSDTFILWFVWVTLGYAVVASIIERQWETLFVVVLTLIFTCVPVILQRRYYIELPRAIAMAGVLFAYASLYLGEILNFYEKFWWWDIFLHAASAIVFGLFGLGVLRMMQSARTIQASAGVVSMFAFTFALAIGAAWEIAEFMLDTLFGLSMQNDSLADTMGDLIVDACGAFVVVVLGYLHWKYHRQNFIGQFIEETIERYKKHLKELHDKHRL